MRVAGSRICSLVRSLTDRDRAILRELALCRFLLTEQLHELYFAEATLDRATQRLRELTGRGLLDSIRYAHDGVHRFAYWHLTSIGLHACRELMPESLMPYKTSRDVRLKAAFLPHCIDVAQVRVGLERWRRAGQMHKEYRWLTAGLARFERLNGRSIERATPDALIAFDSQHLGRTLTYWLEVDEGTMTRRAMLSKAARIRRVLEMHSRKPFQGREWLLSDSVLPTVVCRQASRRAWLEEAFRAAGFDGRLRASVQTYPSPDRAATDIVAMAITDEQMHAGRQSDRGPQVQGT